MALTTEEAASASFAYVKATLATSAARRLAMAAPMPREAPVTSATFLLNLDMESPFSFSENCIDHRFRSSTNRHLDRTSGTASRDSDLRPTVVEKRLDDGGGAGDARLLRCEDLDSPSRSFGTKFLGRRVSIFANQILNSPVRRQESMLRPSRFPRNNRVDRSSWPR